MCSWISFLLLLGKLFMNQYKRLIHRVFYFLFLFLILNEILPIPQILFVK